jgi:hypothetical protein
LFCYFQVVIDGTKVIQSFVLFKVEKLEYVVKIMEVVVGRCKRKPTSKSWFGLKNDLICRLTTISVLSNRVFRLFTIVCLSIV